MEPRDPHLNMALRSRPRPAIASLASRAIPNASPIAAAYSASVVARKPTVCQGSAASHRTCPITFTITLTITFTHTRARARALCACA